MIAIDPSRIARAGALERLSVTEARSRFGDQTFWNGVIAIDPSRKHERERLSVSQSPRLEAVSVMLKPVPLMGNCLIKTDHLWRAR